MTLSTVTSDLWLDPHARELADEAVALLKDHLHTRHYRKGNLLWREGDTSGMLVRVRTGRVKIYRLLPKGRAVTLYLFGPGEVFGFLPFLDGQAYPAYAQALEDVEAEVMARSTLLQLLRAEPDLAVTLIGLLGQRLRAAFELVQALSTPTARARVARALLPLLTPEAASGQGPVEVQLPVSAHEFAGALGLTPEAFSRTVTAMAQDGVLERSGPTSYRILDPAGLADQGD